MAGATPASPGNTLTLLDPGAGPDNLATSLSSTAGGSGRQLQAVPAVVVTAVTVLADKVLSAMIAFATGRAGTAIFGSQAVPVNLAQLINDALTEVDRIVGDRIAEVRIKTVTTARGAELSRSRRHMRIRTQIVNTSMCSRFAYEACVSCECQHTAAWWLAASPRGGRQGGEQLRQGGRMRINAMQQP